MRDSHFLGPGHAIEMPSVNRRRKPRGCCGYCVYPARAIEHLLQHVRTTMTKADWSLPCWSRGCGWPWPSRAVHAS
jgi:hypothetical protein